MWSKRGARRQSTGGTGRIAAPVGEGSSTLVEEGSSTLVDRRGARGTGQREERRGRRSRRRARRRSRREETELDAGRGGVTAPSRWPDIADVGGRLAASPERPLLPVGLRHAPGVAAQEFVQQQARAQATNGHVRDWGASSFTRLYPGTSQVRSVYLDGSAGPSRWVRGCQSLGDGTEPFCGRVCNERCLHASGGVRADLPKRHDHTQAW